MIIIKINKQIRSFVWVKLECEFCGYISENACGHNKTDFFESLIPESKCPECNKTSIKKPILKNATEKIAWLKTVVS